LQRDCLDQIINPYFNQKVDHVGSSTFLLRFKFYNYFPFCVDNCKGQIYYIVHIIQSISRVAIHLGVQLHLVTDDKCKEIMEENKMLKNRLTKHLMWKHLPMIWMPINLSWPNILSLTTTMATSRFSRATNLNKCRTSSLN